MSVKLGDVEVAGFSGGGSIDAIDDITITKNADDEIQAVATVNQNPATGATNPVYDWVGTLAEYQAQNIETLHPDWICYITDDNSDAKTLATAYNVGDTFITKRTDNTLNGAVETDGATYNTTDFTGNGSIGELLEAGKLDYVSLSAYSDAIAQTGWCDKIGWDGAGNTQFRVPTINPRHYIIKTQEPTAENNYTWYKLYADGWVEQGGLATIPSRTGQGSSSITVTFPITMADFNYTGQISYQNGGSYFAQSEITLGAKQTTSVHLDFWTDASGTTASFLVGWQVSGISSIAPQTNTRVMIQIANDATDQALETCTSVLADVAALKYDYVVEFQAPTAENGYTWYRKYKSGWVEQGGRIELPAIGTSFNITNITLLIEMANNNYNACDNGGQIYNGGYGASQQTLPYSTTTVQIVRYNMAQSIVMWQVSGMAAQ